VRPVTPVVVGPARWWLGRSPAVNACRACVSGRVAPWIYKSEGEARRIFTSTLSVCRLHPFRFRPRAALAPSPSHSTCFALQAPSPIRMAPPQSITIIDLLPWPRSTATRLALSELVTAGQLAANEDGRPAAWIDPPATDREPTRRTGTSSASSTFMSAASRRRRAASCAGSASTTAWSCTTSRRTRSRRRLRLSASTKDSWGSQ
jgi:hypothetical protein